MDERKQHKMKILILGSGSFAGQALFSNLLDSGYEVIGINRSTPKSSNYWHWIKRYRKHIEKYWFEINLHKDPEFVTEKIKFFQPTHIIDFMGQGMVAQSWDDPALWYETNLARKSYILESIKNLKSLEKYIRASTPEVYGSSEFKQKEEANFCPSTPYAVSHSAIDYHLRCLGKNYNFPYIIGRFSNFYGEGQQLYRVIPKSILSILNGKIFTIDGNGKSLRSFIHSYDICSAFKALLFKSQPKKEYNFSTSEEISIIDLIRRVCNLTNKNFEKVVKFGPERKGKDFIYRLDCTKSISELGWESTISLNDGLKKVYLWIENNNSYFSKLSWDYEHKC